MWSHAVRGGLINQIYMSMAALALAIASGAEIELAPAVTRNTYSLSMQDALWTDVPLTDFLDVDYIVSVWHSRGVIVHKVRAAGVRLCQPRIRARYCSLLPPHAGVKILV